MFFCFQFTINVCQIHFLISVNEEIFYEQCIFYEKYTSLFILGGRFFVHLTDVLGARWVHANFLSPDP